MTEERARHDPQVLLDLLEPFLASGARREVLDAHASRGDIGDALRRLRSSMADHRFVSDSGRLDLQTPVRRLDLRTRKDGFRVLHAWNHTTHAFTDDPVPVLMLDFFLRAGPEEVDEEVVPAILLDYYLLHLLALCAMRAWDASDPNACLARVTRLLELLQGEGGSGHRFVTDAESLLIYALSQFHPEEQAYDRIIDRVRELDPGHQRDFARVSAAVLGGHLRWGFWLMYGRDVVRMRKDNVGDYPWLLYAVATLLDAWVESRDETSTGSGEPDRTTGALLQALAADPWAFTGGAPSALEPYVEEHRRVQELLEIHGPALLEAFEAHRPTKTRYAPLSLHFNFPHNVLVGITTLALLEGRPQRLPLNALFVDEALAPDVEESQEGLARALMAFSRSSPDRLGRRGAMLVAYDPLSGMRSFSMTKKALGTRFG